MSKKNFKVTRPHFVVENSAFSSAREIFNIYLSKGGVCKYQTIVDRLHRGCDTWAKLLEPPSEVRSAASSLAHLAKRERREREMKEMRDLIEAMDARKRGSL